MSTPEAAAAEDALLETTVRSAFTRLGGGEQARRWMETRTGYSPDAWHQISVDMGLPGLAVPTALGGGGGTYAQLSLVFEQAGYWLLCAPLLSTAAQAVPLLATLPDSAPARRFLEAICAGELTATVALADPEGRWYPDAAAVIATRQADGWVLDGACSYVVDGASAGLVLVPARTDGGVALWALTEPFTGVRQERLGTLDLTRKLSRLEFSDAPGQLLGNADPARIEHALDVSRAMLAAEEVGGAQACLDMTVQHVASRVQWGRPVGSFQAVKHRAADMLILTESARSAARAAAASADAGDLDLATVAAVASWYAAEAFVQVAGDAIQLHGGIGFTWEHDAHLYYKRSRTDLQLLGDPSHDLDRLGRLLEGVVR